jgi:hypothetical protein
MPERELGSHQNCLDDFDEEYQDLLEDRDFPEVDDAVRGARAALERHIDATTDYDRLFARIRARATQADLEIPPCAALDAPLPAVPPPAAADPLPPEAAELFPAAACLRDLTDDACADARPGPSSPATAGYEVSSSPAEGQGPVVPLSHTKLVAARSAANDALLRCAPHVRRYRGRPVARRLPPMLGTCLTYGAPLLPVLISGIIAICDWGSGRLVFAAAVIGSAVAAAAQRWSDLRIDRLAPTQNRTRFTWRACSNRSSPDAIQAPPHVACRPHCDTSRSDEVAEGADSASARVRR